jgi:hypothetical protein
VLLFNFLDVSGHLSSYSSSARDRVLAIAAE